MRLSFCMIVKNEAENLPRCLNSVKAAADELIILDTGSTDATIAIAQSFGAQVYQSTWTNDFSVARNEALRYVTGDWVLVLDADEVFVADVMPSLRQAMQPETIVINLIRQEIGASQSPYSLVSRLFRRHPDLYFSRPYHAMVDDSVAQLLQKEPHWQVIDCPEVAILHYGYQPGAIVSRNKLEKARATMEGFLAAHPNDPYVCSKLGALYVEVNETEQGIELLERGLASSQADAPVCYELYYHLGIAYSRLRNPIEAEQHYRQAIRQPILESLKLGAYNNLGTLLQGKGDLAAAKVLYEQTIAIDPSFAPGYYNLGMVLKASGQLEQAIDRYQQAIALNPTYAEAFQNLGVALLKLSKVPESLLAFSRAIALHEPQNPAEADRLRQGLRQMGFRVGE
ncbi:tetratricopeptide repeat protein [Phormidium tenue FACHB-886]|nr:tetratricopeptide repeat protein [Phormidium tenue FACHB-886]